MKISLSDFFEQHTGILRPQVLLACSGGVDSMVLAHLLLHQGYTPGIVHCNFKLRAEADDDENFVRQWALQNGLAFHSTSFDTQAFAAENKISTQMAARELRYGFFEELLSEHHYDFLLTAHHADDSLETILLKLARKPELLSLAGIRPRTGKILRPLCSQTRKQIEAYAREHDISWREDASNAEMYYQRNNLRHRVIPALKEALPHLDENWPAALRQLNEERLLIQHLLDEKLGKIISHENNAQIINAAELNEQPGAESLLHHWLKPYGNFDIAAIRNVLGEFSGREFTSETHRLLLHRGKLVLMPVEDPVQEEYTVTEKERYLQQPMEIVIGKLPRKDFRLDPAPQAAALDFEKLKFPLKIRRWKAGDFFVPLGMKGKKKLSDFFIDNNFSRSEKDNTWLLCSGKEIVWVMGHRIDERYKLTDQTKTVYFVRILN